ncbi:MAG: DUF2066 domain-containing protein [Gammaproteobacteria bacterium]|nr:DUF2066 domain-containing protein [Gammaproteobacteria bacterium]
MKKVYPFYLFLICLLPLSVQAIKVPGLYEVEVPVIDQSESARLEGLRTAFRLVLIKLTGDSQAAARTSLKPLMSQAQSYLQQYRYREQSKSGEVELEGSLSEKETRLWLKFDEDNLNFALRNLGVPVWGKERPSTLLWLAVDTEAGREIAGYEESPEYFLPIEKRASQRGIALIYPLLDLNDSSSLRASDIWGGFRQPVFDASSRYHTDAILTVSVDSPVPGIWEARWTAYIDNKMANWTSESDILDATLEEGIDRLADILAEQFATTPVDGQINRFKLTVADVFNVDQYAKVLAYLSSLNSVADVEVQLVENGLVEFELEAHGGKLAVSQAIELGRVLSPIAGNRNEYRLLP